MSALIRVLLQGSMKMIKSEHVDCR